MESVLRFLFLFAGSLGIAAIFMRFYWRYKTRKLIAFEATLPTGMPTKCPKCGNMRDTTVIVDASSAPTFHTPDYHERNAFLGIPEHLSYSCWRCGFNVKTAAGKHDEETASAA